MTPGFLMLFEDADIIDHIMIDLMQGLPREEDFINLYDRLNFFFCSEDSVN